MHELVVNFHRGRSILILFARTAKIVAWDMAEGSCAGSRMAGKLKWLPFWELFSPLGAKL